MGKFAKKLAEVIARKKARPLTACKPKIIGGVTKNEAKEQMKMKFGKDGCAKPKSVIKAAVKPKVLSQTPVGMANSTKSSPYIPPAKKTTKPNL